MHCETRSRFATSTRGSVLLYTTEETQSARREIVHKAPPRVIFLTYVMGNKKEKKMAPALGFEPRTKWLTVKLIFVEKHAQNIPSQSFFSVLIFDLSIFFDEISPKKRKIKERLKNGKKRSYS